MFHNEHATSELEHPSWQRVSAPFSMDPMTGCIDFHEAHVSLAPSMPEESFLRACGTASSVDAKSNGWHRYSLHEALPEDLYISIKVYFHEGRLKCVSFSYIPQEELQGAEWSASREQERAAQFQEDLQQQLGKIGSFTWGSANAGIDPKGGLAAIWMVYAS